MITEVICYRFRILERMSQHCAGVMSQLSLIIESSSYWDLLIVCRDGTTRSGEGKFIKSSNSEF